MRKFLIFLFLFVFLIVSLSFAQTKNVKLLGLVPAVDIGEDEYGLTMVDGLFSIASFDEFPSTDTFMVYSRWSGVGDHKVRIQVVDEENNVLGVDERDLSFVEDNNTYSFSHNFENIVFKDPGIYWIEAYLDEEKYQRIPLFVILKENYLDYAVEDNKPLLILSTPALKVYDDEYGLQAISGIFEYFGFDQFPGKVDYFIISNTWYSGDGVYKQHIELLDPDKNIIYKSEPQDIETAPESIIALYDELQNIEFTKPGIYEVKVYLDEDLVLSYPIVVKELEE